MVTSLVQRTPEWGAVQIIAGPRSDGGSNGEGHLLRHMNPKTSDMLLRVPLLHLDDQLKDFIRKRLVLLVRVAQRLAHTK